MKRISTLKRKFYEHEERLLVIQAVNRHLESMIDSQAQYYRWSFLVISGMAR